MPPERWLKKTKQMRVPVIIVDDKVIVGFNQANLDEALK